MRENRSALIANENMRMHAASVKSNFRVTHKPAPSAGAIEIIVKVGCSVFVFCAFVGLLVNAV